MLHNKIATEIKKNAIIFKLLDFSILPQGVISILDKFSIINRLWFISLQKGAKNINAFSQDSGTRSL